MPDLSRLPADLRDALGTSRYLLSEEVSNRLRLLSADEFDDYLYPQVAFLEDYYRYHGRAAAVLVAVSSLLDVLDEFVERPSLMIARLYGLKATLHLAVGGARRDLELGYTAANLAVEHARTIDNDHMLDTFIYEYEMTAAVSLKAGGAFDDSIHRLRVAAKDASAYEIAIPVARQEVLMFQDRRQFIELLENAPVYRHSRRREYFRTLKRFFEYALNQHDLKSAESVLPELLSAAYRLDKRFGVLEQVSLLKNIGQLLALKGQRTRARLLLASTYAVAHRADLGGQQRQITGLLNAIGHEEPARLSSYALA
jgi:hypothetical protein